MSKSIGNAIGIDDSPGVMFTKILNVPDNAMRNYAELITRWSLAEINQKFEELARGALDMRELKHEIAAEIVSIFHGEEAAQAAAADAARMHQGQAPSDAPEFTITAAMPLLDILQSAGLISSRSEGRRLVQQGGIRLDGNSVDNVELELMPTPGEIQVLQVGKRKFLNIVSG
jgi:tyrosyl-tRNA synthetase